jgi:hypothetical protein
MAKSDQIVVFVHGWSVQHTNSYGELPRRLEAELQLRVRHVLLGRYISFRDEVRLQDVSRAFRNALDAVLGEEIKGGRRFACITHSTGGPVVRDWWNRYYRESSLPCPMSHLIMLAPANFGSALAQVGKRPGARVATRVLDWVQPGTGILDWLELGSSESWDLNKMWISGGRNGTEDDPPVFPFVLTGQRIDRKLYDNLNPYTDESGSDGVVRTASANLNATYFRLEQGSKKAEGGGRDQPKNAVELNIVEKENRRAPRTAFALIPGRSHSGTTMGIIRSIKNDGDDHPTVDAVLECLRVSNPQQYKTLCDTFTARNREVRENERLEIVDHTFMQNGIFFHDAHAMVIFRVRDDRGYPIDDFDLTLIGEMKEGTGANFLPKGFLVDRQKNSLEAGVLTFYFSYDAMTGLPAVMNPKDKKDELRKALPGAIGLGFNIVARPNEGFVHYVPGTLQVSKGVLQQFIKADETVLVEIILRRVVHEGVFRLTPNLDPESFRKQPPGDPIP